MESSEEELEAGKVGRPPLDKGAAAMSPEALKMRKRKLMKEQYYKRKISVAKSKAVMQRKDRKSGDVDDNAEVTLLNDTFK